MTNVRRSPSSQINCRNLNCLGLIAACAAFYFGAVAQGRSQVIFNQDFSSSTILSSYIGAGANQFAQIGSASANVSWSAATHALVTTRNTSGTLGTFTIDNLALTTGAVFEFDLNVAPTVAASQQSIIQLRIGSGFAAGTDYTIPSTANSAVSLNVNFNADGSYSFRKFSGGNANSSNFSGPVSMTLAVNNSASSMTYTNPVGGTSTLAANSWSVWADNTALWENVAVVSTAGIEDVKVGWGSTSAGGTVTFDNFVIAAVPEPGAGALILGGVGAMFALRRFRRSPLP